MFLNSIPYPRYPSRCSIAPQEILSDLGLMRFLYGDDKDSEECLEEEIKAGVAFRFVSDSFLPNPASGAS